MKKKYGIIVCIFIMSCFIFGCQKPEEADVDDSQGIQVDEVYEELGDVHVEGMDNVEDVEIDQELIRRANEEEIILDKE